MYYQSALAGYLLVQGQGPDTASDDGAAGVVCLLLHDLCLLDLIIDRLSGDVAARCAQCAGDPYDSGIGCALCECAS